MGRDTILWHDYETSGLDPRRDRPVQFAAQRTTRDLEPVGEPVLWYAALDPDVLPAPQSCVITGLVPGVVPGPDAVEWLAEHELARRIAAVMSVPGTCVAGYNSIRFDDEVTRFLFWRNLMPVYEREWRDGNSRWDLLDALRAACALRPDGIAWPRDADGAPGFRLEELAAANGIEHGDAHDALADVRATLAMARLLREAQPKLFDNLFGLRSKPKVEQVIGGDEPFVHVSGRFPREQLCSSVLLRLGNHRGMRNQVACVDLRHDPQFLLDTGVDELRRLLFTRRDELPADAPRVGVKIVYANRAPVVAPLGVLRDGDGHDDWARIGFDRAVLDERLALVRSQRKQLLRRVEALLARDGDGPDPDAAEALYDGFVSRGDERRLRTLRGEFNADTLRELEVNVDDDRLQELAFRLRCRRFPEHLEEAERVRWLQHCRRQLLDEPDGTRRRSAQDEAPVEGETRVEAVRRELAAMRASHPEHAALLATLEEFVRARVDALGGDAVD